jgi:hypothetical protein
MIFCFECASNTKTYFGRKSPIKHQYRRADLVICSFSPKDNNGRRHVDGWRMTEGQKSSVKYWTENGIINKAI